MDGEEEDTLKFPNPSTQIEDDSINETATVTMVTDSYEEVQRKTKSQCDPESVTELSKVPTTASERQSLAEGKEEAEEEREVKFFGEDESRDSQLFVSAATGEEDRVVMNRGDLAVVAPMVGGGGNDDDVIYKEESQAEETEGKAEVVETGTRADLADETEIYSNFSAETEMKANVVEETGMKLDVVEETEINADVAEEAEMKSDVAEETEMRPDVAEETEVRPDVAEETEVRPDVAEETEMKPAVAEETGIKVDMTEEVGVKEDVADKVEESAEMAKEMEIADAMKEDFREGTEKMAQVLEDGIVEDDKETIHVTEKTDERVGMSEELEIPDEEKAVEVTKEMPIAEEAGMAKETATAVTTANNEIEFGNVTEEPEMRGEEIDVADTIGGETDLAEETEMREGTETEADADAEVDTEMGDIAEEADADVADETDKADVAEETEMYEELEEVSKTVGGKRKRGKSSKPPGRVTSRKKSEEDVCFICFDGGELVLCDRRGCPKAYHPSCVNRDEAFFRAKGRWNCGWHLCSICEKNAYYMCYTCTFSLCKGCIKDAVILCVRGNKGFCETCMKTVMLIERNQQGNKEMDQVDFDDKSSWEYLFKDYWLDLKGRLSLSLDELAHAKSPWKGSDIHSGKPDSPDELYEATNDGGHGSDSSGNAEVTASRRRKVKRRSKSRAKEGDSSESVRVPGAEGTSSDGNVEWASKELLELVMHMRDGDKSVLSQFDVQTLLLDYIKKYRLRDPQRRTHVICDSRLQNLFGKPRVGHFEMLKLLESHFLTKEDSQVDDVQGSVVDTEAYHLEADLVSDVLVKGGKDKKRKTRKKGDERGIQSNLDDYAAIDMHNINLIYLRRNLVEELLEDSETFHDKVVGSFVRIRISGSIQKQDLYRLVQVVGTSKVAEAYRVGKRMTDILLEILNLNKTEVVSIDIISNQDFTEDECKRLRQSIKCGLINRLTVGDIQEKAMVLQAVRVKDWMEAEILRLSHLRDRASDLGRRKELRECVEKLQLLKTPEERQRRLEDIPEIHSDPKMDPSYESDEDDGETDDKKQENYLRPRGSGFSRRVREPISPGIGGSASNDSLSGTRNYSGATKELSRNLSNKVFSNKGDESAGAGEIVNENLWNQARDKETPQLNSWEKPRIASNSETRSPHSLVLPESRVVSEISPAPASMNVAQSTAKINESEKIWHYQDPSGKVQGPFSMVQLRKWSNTGYFPADLRIWRSTEKRDDAILLTDALTGKFNKDPPLVDTSLSQTVSYSGKPHGAALQQRMEAQAGGISNFDQNRTAWNPHGSLGSGGQPVGESWKLQPELSSSTGGAAASSLEVPKHFRDGWASETNLPSPTPSTAVQTKGKTFEKEWSPTPTKPSGSLVMTNLFSGGNGGQQPSTVLGPESGQVMHSPIPPSSTSKLSGNVDSLNVSHGVTSASKPETGELHRALVNTHQLPSTNSVVTSVNPGVDIKNLGAALQSLVQPVTTQIPVVETHGWGSGLVARPEMISPSPKPGSGSQAWGNASSQKLEPNNQVPVPAPSTVFTQPHASSFSAGNPSGVFPAPGQSVMPPSDTWRPLVPGQSNIQPPAQPHLAWGMGVTGNQSAVPRQGPENQSSTGWGPMPGNPNMGWGGQPPANTNWGAPGQAQAPGNANSGWSAPGHAQVPGNAIPSWVPPGQGPAPVNANPGWVAPGQGPPPGNANPGWGTPTGNPSMWGNEQNNGGDRFSNQRDRSSQGGDSGYSGGRPWNRQSSFGSRGGDSSRPPFNKGQRVCKFHESGHCKKGSQCDYLHT